jgi:hypothetical protein
MRFVPAVGDLARFRSTERERLIQQNPNPNLAEACIVSCGLIVEDWTIVTVLVAALIPRYSVLH